MSFPKGDHRKERRRRRREKAAANAEIRGQVFDRDRQTCRVCGCWAQSMHELKFRSLGGRVSLENSVAVCGTGTTGCHGLLQSLVIMPASFDARRPIRFVLDANRQGEEVKALLARYVPAVRSVGTLRIDLTIV